MIDSKPISVPKSVEIKSDGLKQTLETLKVSNRMEEDPEITIVACLRQIYQDNKMLHTFLDSLKNSYVIDNTKLIEFEEKTYNLKSLLKDAAKSTATGENFNLKIRNLKLSICREIMQLRLQKKASLI